MSQVVVCPIVWSSRMFAHCCVRGIGDQKIYLAGFKGVRIELCNNPIATPSHKYPLPQHHTGRAVRRS